jgi:hypothetical protein
MISINGKVFKNGRSVSVINSHVIVDGIEISGDRNLPENILEIRVIEGTIEELKTDVSVSCLDVAGNIEAGGSVSCDKVGGDVHAGGSVSCDEVGGSIYAGCSVSHG